LYYTVLLAFQQVDGNLKLLYLDIFDIGIEVSSKFLLTFF